MAKNEFYKDSFLPFGVKGMEIMTRIFVKKISKVKKFQISNKDEGILKKTFKSAALITCNHPTDADPPTLYSLLRKMKLEFRIMTARDVMSRWPSPFRKIAQMGGCFSVDRLKVDRKALSRSIEILSNNKTLIIFPEGKTHGQSSRIIPYQPGPIKIALWASKKIKKSLKLLPVAIYYSIIGDKEKIVNDRLLELESTLGIDRNNSISKRLSVSINSIIEKSEQEEGIDGKKFKNINLRIKNLCKVSIDKIESKLEIEKNEKKEISNRIQKAREVNDFTKDKKLKKRLEKKILRLHSLSSLDFKHANKYPTYERIEEILTILLKESCRLVDKKFTIKTEKKCHLALGKIIEINSLKKPTLSAERILEKLEKNTIKTLNILEKKNGTIIKEF